jgi:hypothetical protein
MTMTDPIDVLLNPRHIWLRLRVKEIINAIQELEKIGNWEQYLKSALDLSKELSYATTEWEKYYND